MTRLTTVAAFLVASALATSAYADQKEIAEKLNEEGKALMFKNKYVEATGKFRQAIARLPGEPKYFLNLCTSLYHEGKFGEALTACNAVGNNNPSAEQRTKADKLTGLINEEAKAQGVPIEPLGGGKSPGDPPPVDCTATPNDPSCEQVVDNDLCKTNPQDPSCGGGNNNNNNNVTDPPPPQPRYAVGRPPSGTGVFVQTTPDNKYTWTLGIDVFGGGGTIGRDQFYGTATGGFRIKGDYLLNPAARLGAQAYLQITRFGQGEMDSFGVEALDIFDFGIAAYKHLCPRGAQRLCLTPLAGAQLAMMSPADEMNSAGEQVFNYAAVGGRLELGAHFALGSRMEHVLGAMVGVNIYSPVFSGPDEFSGSLTVEQAGLDKGGAAAYVGIGYTYRFRTPLGRAAFITLE
jgi:hypothetical protein